MHFRILILGLAVQIAFLHPNLVAAEASDNSSANSQKGGSSKSIPTEGLNEMAKSIAIIPTNGGRPGVEIKDLESVSPTPNGGSFSFAGIEMRFEPKLTGRPSLLIKLTNRRQTPVAAPINSFPWNALSLGGNFMGISTRNPDNTIFNRSIAPTDFPAVIAFAQREMKYAIPPGESIAGEVYLDLIFGDQIESARKSSNVIIVFEIRSMLLAELTGEAPQVIRGLIVFPKTP